MPSTKDTLMGVGVAAAVAMGGVSLARSAAVPAGTAPRVAMADMPQGVGAPPPDHCREACASLADAGCIAGQAVNCVDLLRGYERDSADGGAHFSCSEPITRAWLDSVNWCPGVTPQ